MTETKVVICPYCGETQAASERCRGCGGFFEPLSRQATHNAMGPWFIRDPAKPFHPGCSYQTLARMIDRGQITRSTIIRGPTTRQFWTVAGRVQGVAHLLGCCHNCDAAAHASDHGCHACGVPFGAFRERDSLGLPEIRPLPWQGGPGDETGPDAAQSAGAGSISRFASDEELLRPSPAAPPAGAWNEGGKPSPARVTDDSRPGAQGPAAAADVGGDTVFDDYASSAITRALRRRIAEQQRTIRIMMVVLIGATAIAVGTSIVPLASRIRQESAATQSPTVPQDAAAQSQPQNAPPAGGQEPDAESARAPQDAAPVQADESAKEPTASAFDGAYADALELISLGERQDRTLDERIGDYERALQSLEVIEGAAPGAERPQGLDARIAHVRHELERLRLEKAFFG